MVDLICVDPARVDEIWPHVAPLLLKATEACGDWSLSDIGAILDRGGLLWVIFDGERIGAAAVTKLIQTKHGLVCHALACGGESEEWQEHLSKIEEYAKAESCVLMRVDGREGWKRVFRDYRVAWITLEKRISE